MAATCAVAGRLTDQKLVYYAEWTQSSKTSSRQKWCAVLVYRLVCQPVTLESRVRLPGAASKNRHPIQIRISSFFGLHFESYTNLFVPDVWIISPLAPLLLAILLLIDFTEPVDLAVTHATGSRAIANRGQEEPPAWEGDCSQIFQRSPSLQGCSNSTTC